jgi:hypothetical protein
MAGIISILIYILYKIAEVSVSLYFLNYFTMRFDLLLAGFYGFLSLFQLIFIVIQSLSRSKEKKQLSMVFQYTTIITILMELVALAMGGYYLMIQENDLYNLLLILTFLTPANILFYLVHSAVFTRIIRKRQIIVDHISVMPTMVFIFLSFGIPAAYVLSKTFVKNSLTPLDISLITAIFLLDGIAMMTLFIGKALKGRKIGGYLRDFSLSLYNQDVSVDDPNEYGFIQSQLQSLNKKLLKDKEDLTLYNDYISQNMRTQITKFAVNPAGESKTSTITTIRYHILDDLSAERQLIIVNSIIRIIGEYADEYESYPLFEFSKAHLFYGIPYYYEHQRYNAIEASQKMIEDIQKLSVNEDVKISVAAGIFSGEVVSGPLNTRGRDYREYAVFGKGLETSEKISALAESQDLKILACTETVKGLENKFFPEKTYKIKMKNGEEITAYLMRL